MTTPSHTHRFVALMFAWAPHLFLNAQEQPTINRTPSNPPSSTITRPTAKLPDSPLVNMTLVGNAATDPNYFIWCTSPIQDADGKVHLFCSRWPKTKNKMGPWVTHSEVVRYVGDGPEGPFKLANVVVPAKPGAPWNNSLHNPAITKAGDTFTLTYLPCLARSPALFPTLRP